MNFAAEVPAGHTMREFMQGDGKKRHRDVERYGGRLEEGAEGV